mmetsp:Transcript_33015/g.83825  ORF Transcript_33015/g.83825 Transcript_33015/m.83825 type:complete len:402 (-) Transcript_33015:3-1208(-)
MAPPAVAIENDLRANAAGDPRPRRNARRQTCLFSLRHSCTLADDGEARRAPSLLLQGGDDRLPQSLLLRRQGVLRQVVDEFLRLGLPRHLRVLPLCRELLVRHLLRGRVGLEDRSRGSLFAAFASSLLGSLRAAVDDLEDFGAVRAIHAHLAAHPALDPLQQGCAFRQHCLPRQLQLPRAIAPRYGREPAAAAVALERLEDLHSQLALALSEVAFGKGAVEILKGIACLCGRRLMLLARDTQQRLGHARVGDEHEVLGNAQADPLCHRSLRQAQRRLGLTHLFPLGDDRQPGTAYFANGCQQHVPKVALLGRQLAQRKAGEEFGRPCLALLPQTELIFVVQVLLPLSLAFFLAFPLAFLPAFLLAFVASFFLSLVLSFAAHVVAGEHGGGRWQDRSDDKMA